MKNFSDKVREARCELDLKQSELAKEIGVSTRTIGSYEFGERKPRFKTLLKLAKALKVSSAYLSDDECEDPLKDIEKDGYIEATYEQQGSKAAADVGRVLAESTALFAGGDLSQEQKDAFFEAIMRAYTVCKDAAKIKYGKKED